MLRFCSLFSTPQRHDPIPQNSNIASTSQPVKPGHILLKHLQQRLRETPLSNPQLDEYMRRELETSLIVMVRFNLKETTPAYQEESAQIIINNWEGLSDETKTLIKKFCAIHVQEQEICPHYKKTLKTILEKTTPSNPITIHPQTPEEIAPSTSEIQEEPTPSRVQWLDEQTPGKSLAKVPSASLPFAPKYKQGHKIRWFEDKAWRAVKTQIKQEYVHISWTNFLDGTIPRNVQKTLLKKVQDQLQDNQQLKTKAEQYIEKTSQKSLYTLYGTGHGIFRAKGTTLSSRVYRATRERFYTLLGHVDQKTRTQIKDEQGVKYKGTTLLGKGSFGKVRLANLYENGTRHIVAAKETASEEADMLKRENNIRNILKGNASTANWVQTNDFIRQVSVGDYKSKPVLFMDLHAQGSLNTVTHQLSKISNRVLREKAARTVAQQLVQNIFKLHQADIAHRDIKPENLMLSKDGNIIPIDFGLSSNQENISGASSGTPQYAAPEELEEQPNRKPKRADIYSLGQVLSNVWEAARIRKDDPLQAISNSLIHPNPAERPELTRVSEQLGKDTFTPNQLLHVLLTGKQPTQIATPNTPANADMA